MRGLNKGSGNFSGFDRGLSVKLALALLLVVSLSVGASANCSPPSSGDWFIESYCEINSSTSTPADVFVDSTGILNITQYGALDIDLQNNSLVIREVSSASDDDGGGGSTGGSGGGEITGDAGGTLKTVYNSQNAWNRGTFLQTSADRKDNSGTLGLGYKNGSIGWKDEGDNSFTEITGDANLGSTPGGGALVLSDLNEDGYIDFFMKDNYYNSGNVNLRKNQGNNIFEDNSGEITTGSGRGASAADYQGDDDRDIIHKKSGDTLENNTGSFTFDDSVISDNLNTENMMWVDIDGDGDLDIFIPDDDNTYQWLENEDSSLSFTEREGLPGASLPSYSDGGEGSSMADINNDGYPDFIIAAGTNSYAFLSNNGHDYDVVNDVDGTLGLPEKVEDHHNMEWAWGDYDNDGDNDVFISGPSGDGLYRNDGTGSFTEVTSSAGISVTNPDGADWGDYNNDGRLDLVLVQCGTVSAGSGSECGSPDVTLYKNQGGSFADATSEVGLDSSGTLGRPLGFFDSDNDGDLDLISNDPLELWRNNQNDGNYLDVIVRGNTSKSGGAPATPIGAQVYLYDSSGDKVGYRELRGTFNTLQPPLRQHFGVDPDALYDVSVWFPSSHTWTNFTDVKPEAVSASVGGNELLNTLAVNESVGNESTNLASISSTNKDAGDDLLGYWRFDKTSGEVKDYSGHGNPGNAVNFTSNQRGSNGVFSTSSFDFDGDDTGVFVTENESLEPREEITVSLWIKRDGAQSDYAKALWYGDNSGSPYGPYGFEHEGASDNDIGFRVVADDSGASASTTIPNGEWINLVGKYNGTHVSIYKNGSLQDSSPNSGLISDYVDPDGLSIGASNNDVNHYDGKIDEVRIYDKALNQEKINELYINGKDERFNGTYKDVLDKSGTREWLNFEVETDIPSETDVNATFKALDDSGNVKGQKTIDLGDGTTDNLLGLEGSQLNWSFSGYSDNETKTWEVLEAAIYYNGTSSTSVTSSDTLDTRQDWNKGIFNGTSADRKDNSGTLGIGYLDGSKAGQSNVDSLNNDDLMLYWRMDSLSGSFEDFSGTGNSGSNDGGTRGATGLFSTDAVNFDGGDSTADAVQASDDPTLDSGLTELTFSVWAKFDSPSNSGSDKHFIIVKETSGSNIYSLAREPDSDVSYAGENGMDLIQTNNAVDDTDWHHYVGTLNDTHQKLYLDGELQAKYVSSGLDPGDSDAELSVGGFPGVGNGLDGSVDELRIYNRSLTESEVRDLYFSGREGTYNGNYTTATFDNDFNQTWNSVDVDLSNLPSSTDVDAEFRALKGDGTQVDSQVIDLSEGLNSYDLNVESSRDAEIFFNGTSTSETQSWEIESVSVSSSGTSETSWQDNGGFGFKDITSSANLGSSPGGGSLVLSDLNEDGYVDFYMNDNNFGSDAGLLRKNDGDSSFTSYDSEVDYDGRGASAADYEEDGDRDIVSMAADTSVGPALQTNVGDFSFSESFVGSGTNDEVMIWVDVNGDGLIDIFAPEEQNNYFWHENNGDGTFTSRSTMPGSSYTGQTKDGGSMADINNDGYPDYVVQNGSSSSGVFLSQNGYDYKAKTAGSIGLPDNVNSHHNMEWAWADYDSDGDIDVYISGPDGDGLYRNDGTGNFEEVTSQVIDASPDWYDVGTFTSTDGSWSTVEFDGSFQDPVVIGSPITENNDEVSLVFEARNIDSDSAEVRLCEESADGTCDTHPKERGSFMVVDQSDTDDVNGVEAGTFGINGDEEESVSFSESYSSEPVMVAAVQSDNGADAPVVPYVSSRVDTAGFSMRMCQFEGGDSCDDGSDPHPTEKIGWVVINRDDVPFESAVTGDFAAEEDTWYSESFSEDFSKDPVPFGFTNTDSGGQEYNYIGIRNLNKDSMEIEYREQESADGTDTHASERIRWFAVGGSTVSDPDGVDWGDYDNDGDQDLVLVQCGSVSDSVGQECSDPQDTTLYENQGDGTFVDASRQLDDAGNLGRPVGFFDVDNDGDLDLISNDPTKLFENKENDGNFLRVLVRGNTSKTNGSARIPIGAQVYLYDSTDTLVGHRQLYGSYNQLQPPARQHFGVDPENEYDVRVFYPANSTWTNFTDIEPSLVSARVGDTILQNTLKVTETVDSTNKTKALSGGKVLIDAKGKLN